MRTDVAPGDYGNDIIDSCQQNAATRGTVKVSIGKIHDLFNEYIWQDTNNKRIMPCGETVSVQANKKPLTPENDTATIYSIGPCLSGHFDGK
jgi:hypothetical protein